MSDSGQRGQWGSKVGFVLAAAGSAVGLGNMWKFPYITGENGGGAFVAIYLVCILLIGLPIMVGEVVLGKMTQKSPVGAFGELSSKRSPWVAVGWLGVITGFLILSFYSVVAGWAMHYVYLSLTGVFNGVDPAQAADFSQAQFDALTGSATFNMLWHTVFMGMTIGIVLAGVQKGVETAARVLMPTLFALLVLLVVYGTSMPGFDRAFDFVFGLHTEDLTGAGVLEALGHSFFTLSVGMGAMLTYGSYMKRDDDVVATSITITALDTAVALLACLALFPITFTFGLEAGGGPGLVFVSMPTSFAQMTGGSVWSTLFFLLLTFAALTSAISLLEVVASYFIDELKWSRMQAVLVTGGAIFVFGVPSALGGAVPAFGSGMEEAIGHSWFGLMDYLTSNWMLPLGGLGLSLFVGFRIRAVERAHAVADGSLLGGVIPLYLGWLQLLRFAVPVAILLVILHAVGVL